MARPRESIKAYGDRLDDGAVQLSFTLPVAASPRARAAARLYAEQLGLEKVLVAHMEACGDGFSYFVVYGASRAAVDFDAIDVPVVETHDLSMEEVGDVVKRELGGKVVVVGACTGSDAHTVGIDAILNMKGYAGDYGLERYAGFEVHNLGAQIDNSELVRRALEVGAHAVLLSQVVTQRDCHKENAAAFMKELVATGRRGELLALFGGPRVDHALALALGFDAGFGTGTRPSEVANYIVGELRRRRGGKERP
ncbi:MAG: cobalamin B12-binding domain-containing protein [Deltaproteobacteria bacterium]|nr:cobalamin B12-binding domain-containing protein [Deltaproteobacteria bacterium]